MIRYRVSSSYSPGRKVLILELKAMIIHLWFKPIEFGLGHVTPDIDVACIWFGGETLVV